MDGRPLARAALVGVLLTTLVSLFVLNGAGWVLADPADRGASDEGVGATTLDGVVVATNPVTVEYGDGQRIVLADADPDTAVGESVEVSLAVDRTAAGTADIPAQPGQRSLMYAFSFLAGLLVLGRVLDTWRIRPRALAAEPRERPLHRTFFERYRPADSSAEDGDRELVDRATDGGVLVDRSTGPNDRAAREEDARDG